MKKVSYTVIEEYGYDCFESHKLAKIIDDDLIIGGKKVIGYSAKEFDNLIPRIFTIRHNDGKFAKMVCTFDLADNDKCWTTGMYFDSVEECFAFIVDYKKYENFEIHLEEPMLIS